MVSLSVPTLVSLIFKLVIERLKFTTLTWEQSMHTEGHWIEYQLKRSQFSTQSQELIREKKGNTF